jgi:hypothetical protein
MFSSNGATYFGIVPNCFFPRKDTQHKLYSWKVQSSISLQFGPSARKICVARKDAIFVSAGNLYQLKLPESAYAIIRGEKKRKPQGTVDAHSIPNVEVIQGRGLLFCDYWFFSSSFAQRL